MVRETEDQTQDDSSLYVNITVFMSKDIFCKILHLVDYISER